MNTPEFGAMHWRTALFLVAVTLLGYALIFFGYIHGSYLVASIPLIYAWARPSLYRLLSDATYHAHHRFERDVTETMAEARHEQTRQVVTLDADMMLRGLRLDDEQAGRA